MPVTNFSVRASRDGDQFHYLWAARRCLRLLSAADGLVAIAIEGPSPGETLNGSSFPGEEVIDVAEYYGSQEISRANLVRYIQLKHSTLHLNDAWTPSELEATITAFAQRYQALRQQFGGDALHGKIEFIFISNRPVAPYIHESVAEAAATTPAKDPSMLEKLQRFTGLAGQALSGFCKTFRIEDGQDGYWDQRNILFQDVSGYSTIWISGNGYSSHGGSALAMMMHMKKYAFRS